MQNYSDIYTSTQVDEFINTTLSTGKPLSEAAYRAIAAYLTIIGVGSICGNGIVILVLTRGKTKFYRVYNTLMLNLAVADLLLSLGAFPFSSSSNYSGRWLYTDAGCTFTGFWVFTMAVVDMNTLAVISICRYIVACKQGWEHLLNRHYARYMLIGIWLYALIWTGAPLLGWSRYTYEAYGTSCTIDWAGRTLSDKTYNVTIFFTCFMFHIIIFIFCYTNVILELKKVNRMNMHRGDEIEDTECEETTIKLEFIVWYHKVITSKQITALSIAMVGSFVIAWMPYTVLSLYIMFGADVPIWSHVLPTMLAKGACLSNPIIYALTSSRFRDAAISIFRRKTATVKPENTNSLRNTIHRSNLRYNVRTIEVREYRGHMTRDGIYIGLQELSMPVESHIF